MSSVDSLICVSPFECVGSLDTPDARLRLAAMTVMASSIAHEVNQPLTAATNLNHASARQLRDLGEGFEQVISMIEDAARETMKAGETIRRMRNFIVSGKIVGRSESLRAMVQGVTASIDWPDMTGIEVVTKFDPAADMVTVERLQIEQVLRFILGHAIEALEGCPSPRIAITTAPMLDRVELRIQHSGPGLSDYGIARMFEAHQSRADPGKALAMPICKAIVEAHGGRLWAESPDSGGVIIVAQLLRPHPAEAE